MILGKGNGAPQRPGGRSPPPDGFVHGVFIGSLFESGVFFARNLRMGITFTRPPPLRPLLPPPHPPHPLKEKRRLLNGAKKLFFLKITPRPP